MANTKPVGLTKDVGWQIGARATLDVSSRILWDALISPAGVCVWLGECINIEWRKGAGYRLPDGTVGAVRVFKPYSHLRLTWQPPSYPRPSTIQVHAISKGNRAVLAFHQEHLPDQQARFVRRDFFRQALDNFKTLLAL